MPLSESIPAAGTEGRRLGASSNGHWFLIVLEADVQGPGAGRFGVWYRPASGFTLGTFSRCPPVAGVGMQLFYRGLFYRGANPIQGAPPSGPTHLLKAPPPNTIPRGVRVSHVAFGSQRRCLWQLLALRVMALLGHCKGHGLCL